MLFNVVTNAIKFTAPGGSIALGYEVNGARMWLQVRDSGRGIAARTTRADLEPFVQVDRRVTREADGVGLGLAISRGLVD